MDKILRDGLQVLLLHAAADNVLNRWNSHDGTRHPYYQDAFEGFASKLVKQYPERYSRDDAAFAQTALNYKCKPDLGAFDLILTFAKETLTLENNIPVLRYEEVLRWRDTTHPLGTTPFVYAFLASQDIKTRFNRQSFTMNPVLSTNNKRLKIMLSKGMAENHYHLKGSAPAFLLSWVYLMNSIMCARKPIEKMEHDLLGTSLDKPKSLYTLVWKSALIRSFLYEKFICGAEKHILSGQLKYALKFDASECEAYADTLQSRLSALRATQNMLISGAVADYAMNQNDKSVYSIFSGEHYFQYAMFRALCKGDSAFTAYADLFYFYLITFTRFRSEMIQSNKNFGFSNFDLYESRKSFFVDNDPTWKSKQIAIAARINLDDSRIYSFEARIVPKETTQELSSQICFHNEVICETLRKKDDILGNIKLPQKMFYVLHKPKRRDKVTQDVDIKMIRCRDHMLRCEVDALSKALIELRSDSYEAANYINGVDACANEIGCRPEVFAPSFRALKAHQPLQSFGRKESVPNLHLTYHIGEDFLDIIDGLRSIDEAILFLGLSQGDRIGHALALGIEPTEWYFKKHNRIILPRQDFLDNCAWMIYMLSKTGKLNGIMSHVLHEQFMTQAAYIFRRNTPFPPRDHYITPDIYMASWLLRGDLPDCYKFTDPKDFTYRLEQEKLFNPYALNLDEKGLLHETRRHNLQAIWLYHDYHFNPSVKGCGSEIVEFEVTDAYSQAVIEIQKMMQEKVASENIGIECNPSSNVLIGSFKRYDSHPIVRFNDSGLRNEKSNSKLFISINTDDQGVFDTCLENEYALLARGIEQIKDKDGNAIYSPNSIYDWLDRMREMGLEQSFQ